MKAVMYGAGNIGRGFIGMLFSQSGYETVFIDINKETIELLNEKHEYPVKVVSNDNQNEIIVKNVRAVNGNNIETVADEIASCDIMCSAVGVNILPYIAENLAEGIRRRSKSNSELNIIICENLINADEYLKSLVKEQLEEQYYEYLENNVGFIEASVGRMVPVMTEETKEGNPLKVWVEPFCTLPVDKEAFKGGIPSIKNMEPSSPFEYHIQSKLFLHNMGHSLTAYLGSPKGYEFIWQAIEDAKIREICQKAMEASALALSKEHNKPYEQVKAYAYDLISRFGNRYLGDTTARVGKDTKRKLLANDRLAGATMLCKKHGIDNSNILYGIVAGLLFKSDDSGTKEVQLLLEQKGIGAVLEEICGFEKGTSEYDNTIKLYNAMKNRL
jgi:mannitol-1-phosphate 5-dehydrogenase